MSNCEYLYLGDTQKNMGIDTYNYMYVYTYKYMSF